LNITQIWRLSRSQKVRPCSKTSSAIGYSAYSGVGKLAGRGDAGGSGVLFVVGDGWAVFVGSYSRQGVPA
jgi:hypothetical protein